MPPVQPVQVATSMQHTLGGAARMAGLSKSTLSRAIKEGKLSAIRSDDTGSYKIEQSELERYAATMNVVRATAENHAALQEGTHQERQAAAVLEAEMAGLKQLAELLRAQLRDTQQQRDAWQQQAERLALPRPVSPAAETMPTVASATVPMRRSATGLAPLGNPLAHIWQWLADQLGRVAAVKHDQLDQATAAGKPTAPANLARFGHGCLAPAGEPRRLDRAALLRELALELERNATPVASSSPRNSSTDTPDPLTILAFKARSVGQT